MVIVDPALALALMPTDIHGWTGADVALVYAAAAVAAPEDACFVEVGSWFGRSAILMALLIQSGGRRVRFACVDTFRGSVSDQEGEAAALAEHGGNIRHVFETNLRRYGVDALVEVIEEDSVTAAGRFAPNSLDFVFLDADHSYESVCADLCAWLPKMKPGGVLAGHDWNWMGVTDAVRDILGTDTVRIIGTCWLYGVPSE